MLSLRVIILIGLSVSMGCGRKFVDGVSEAPDAVTNPKDASSTADAALPNSWCQQQPNTVYVHALLGNDGNNGDCATPKRSISKAVEVASINGFIETIQIAGGSGAALIYGVNETGETLPLVLSRKLQVVGAGANLVTIRGGGAVPGETDAFVVHVQGDVTIQGLNVQGSGDGILVRSQAGLGTAKLNLDSAEVSNCGGIGIVAYVGAVANIQNSVLAGNRTGIKGNSYEVSLLNSEIRGSVANAVTMFNEGSVVSMSSRYINNRVAVNLLHNAGFRSNLDTFDGNKNGLSISDPQNAAANADITGAVFKNHTEDVLALGFSFNVKLRGTTILGNLKNGIAIVNPMYTNSKLDLGTTLDPGGNTLQSTVGGNGGAGICNLSGSEIVASGNTFRSCPVTMSASCAGGVDTSGNVVVACP
jgi:hypothetical protein